MMIFNENIFPPTYNNNSTMSPVPVLAILSHAGLKKA